MVYKETMVTGHHFLRDEYRKTCQTLSCNVGEEDYTRLESRLPLLADLARIENRSLALYDVHARRFLLKLDRHLELLGLSGPGAPPIDDMEAYFALIHPDDLPFLMESQLRMREYLLPLPGADKRDYKLIYDYRVRAADGRWVRFLHQLALFELDRDGRAWILLVLSDVLSTDAEEGRPRRFLVHTPTGRVVLFAEETGTGKYLLSPREKEILELVCQGLESREIADRLRISPNTVNNHRQNILRRTGSRNGIQAAAWARFTGVI